MDLVRRFLEHVSDEGLLGGDVLVACSGGADSTALARLLAAAAAEHGSAVSRVALAHLDHGLREGSEADARFVGDLAAELGVEVFVERRKVNPAANESPEAAARRTRYAFLRGVAEAEGFSTVATAHHQDDQAETVLYRVLTGTGVRGLAGIRARRPLFEDSSLVLVRPLLPFRARELRDWLAAGGHTWREDPTNVDGNVRARLRNRAIPMLAECVARDPVPLLARLAAVAAGEDALRTDATELASAWIDEEADRLTLLPGFERLPDGALVWALAAPLARLRGDATPPSRAESARLLRLAAGDDAETVGGIEVRHGQDGTVVFIRQAPPAAIPTPMPLDIPGSVELPSGSVVRAREAALDTPLFLERLGAGANFELLDADCVDGPLTVRARAPGDRFVPLGRDRETRLSRFLHRGHVPASERDHVPLVCDAEGIIWVAGHRLADRVKLRPDTRRALVLEVDPSGPPASGLQPPA